MTHVIVLPIWQLILIVALVAAGTSIPCSAFGARRGARMAIKVCSARYDCNMAKASEHAGWTKKLQRQAEELKREHPDVRARRESEDKERDSDR